MNKGRGVLSSAGTFSITYNLPYRFYKLITKSSIGELSSQAQMRLLMIEFYYQIKDASVVSNLFKVSRKAFYNGPFGTSPQVKKLSSLEKENCLCKGIQNQIFSFRF